MRSRKLRIAWSAACGWQVGASKRRGNGGNRDFCVAALHCVRTASFSRNLIRGPNATVRQAPYFSECSRVSADIFPHPQAAKVSVAVVAATAAMRNRLEFFGPASTKKHIVSKHRIFQECDSLAYRFSPRIKADLVEGFLREIVFKSLTIFKWQLPECDLTNGAVGNQCCSYTCAEATIEHPAALVASQRLHVSVIHD